MAGPLIGKFGTFEYSLADRYRFESELGRGGMGTVYRARDVRHPRSVAIKMLHTSLTNDYGVLRFQKEIEIAAQLQHPHIVRLLDSGVADGRLYYVMEYLEGESLRDRIKREVQLSVEDALTITRQVGEALQYAHDRGIVHRDIKPENIIIADGRAHVVDFGLARALSAADADRLTASGLAVGTPHYMAPEQAAGERNVGPLADQYALACVLYEMLVGEPPFTGPSAAAIATRHQIETPATLRVRRRSVPTPLDAAVMRALEKVPTDRFGSIHAFVGLISADQRDEETIRRGNALGYAFTRSKRRRVLSAALTALFVLGLFSASLGRASDVLCGMLGNCLDSLSYVVLPVAQPTSGERLDAMFQQALTRWTDVTVPPVSEVAEQIARTGLATNDPKLPERVARHFGAAHVIMVGLSNNSVAKQFTARVIDPTGRTIPRTVAVAAELNSAADSSLEILARRVLFGPLPATANLDQYGTTRSTSFKLYLAAQNAVTTWKLTEADSELTAALRGDPGFAEATILLAQIRSWQSDDTVMVSGLLRPVVHGRYSLTARLRRQALALSDLTEGRLISACARYDSLAAEDSSDVAAWIGVGDCNYRNHSVVPNAGNGYRFAGSRERAFQAYSRAFSIIGRVDACCAARAEELQRRTLMYMPSAIQFGYTPSGAQYGAYPELKDDTLALVPRPIANLNRAPPPTHDAALKAQRERLFSLARLRVSRWPNDPNALKELAHAMELLNYSGVIDTIRRARFLSKEASERLSLATREVWLRVRASMEGNTDQATAARLLADSILTSARPHRSDDYAALAGLAALLGRTSRAAALTAGIAQAYEQGEFPPEVVRLGNALLAYAATGEAIDSLSSLDERLLSGIVNTVMAGEQSKAISTFFGRSARLAFPTYRMKAFERIDTAGNPLIRAEAVFMRGDRRGVRRVLDELSTERRAMPPAHVSFEAVYPEAWLRIQVGDTAAARDLLLASLGAAPFAPTEQLSHFAAAGSLVNSIRLLVAVDSATNRRAEGDRWRALLRALER